MGDKKTPSASLKTALTPEQLMSAMTMYGHAAVSAVPSKEKLSFGSCSPIVKEVLDL